MDTKLSKQAAPTPVLLLDMNEPCFRSYIPEHLLGTFCCSCRIYLHTLLLQCLFVWTVPTKTVACCRGLLTPSRDLARYQAQEFTTVDGPQFNGVEERALGLIETAEEIRTRKLRTVPPGAVRARTAANARSHILGTRAVSMMVILVLLHPVRRFLVISRSLPLWWVHITHCSPIHVVV